MSAETWTFEDDGGGDAGGFPGFAPRTVPKRDHRRVIESQTVARASWLILGLSVFTLLIFSRAWITVVVGPEGDAEGSALIRNLFIPAYLAAIALALSDWRRSARAAVSGAIPFLMVALAFISCAWSIAPDLTARRALALFFTTVAATALAARLDWTNLARVLAGTFGVLAVGSAVVAVAMPHVGRMEFTFPGAWRGLWTDKNALGDYMALGVCACAGAAILDRRLRPLWLATGGLCLLLIVLSTSKTSIVALAAGMGALTFTALARRSAVAATVTVLCAVVLALVAGGVIWVKPHLILDLLHKDATLTGRTEIWEAVLRRVAERPVTGFGYAVVWNDASGWGPLAWIVKEAHFTPHHAHNSWLEAELELGYAGVALLALFALQTVWRLIRGGEGVWLAAPILAAFGVATLTETVAMNYNDFMWVIIPALVIRLGLKDAAAPRTALRPVAPLFDPASTSPERHWAV